MVEPGFGSRSLCPGTMPWRDQYCLSKENETLLPKHRAGHLVFSPRGGGTGKMRFKSPNGSHLFILPQAAIPPSFWGFPWCLLPLWDSKCFFPPKAVLGYLWLPGKGNGTTFLLEIPFLIFSPHLNQLHLPFTPRPLKARKIRAKGAGQWGVWTPVPGHGTLGLSFFACMMASVSIGHYHFMRLWAKTGKERDVFLEGCAVEEKDTENIRLERTHNHPFQLQGCRGSVRGRSWIAHSWVLEKLGFQVRHQLISVRLFTSFFNTLDLLQGYKECMRAVAWVLLWILSSYATLVVTYHKRWKFSFIEQGKYEMCRIQAYRKVWKNIRVDKSENYHTT